MKPWLWLIALPLGAQNLTLRTEFLRPGSQGEVLRIDATPHPRELISPAVVRNAFASFHIVVESTRTNYFLFAGSNPENVFRIAIYQEEFVQVGQDWIPDALKPVELPHFGVIPDPQSWVQDQRARCYLMDVWVPETAPVGRTRLEVQIKAGTWTIWPMEVRVLPAIVPPLRERSRAPLPPLAMRADESAMAPLVDYLGRGKGRTAMRASLAAPRSIREIIRRNAEQDMALARGLDGAELRPALREKLAQAGPGEWYLAVRELIYRLASRGEKP